MKTCQPGKQWRYTSKISKQNTLVFRGKPRITLPTILSEDLKRAETIASRENLKIPLKLSTIDDLTEHRKISENRKQWKLLVETINLNYPFQQ